MNMHRVDVITQSPNHSLHAGGMCSIVDGSRPVESDNYRKLDTILSLLFPSIIHVQQSQTIHGHLHSLHLLALSNGVQLLLKGSPVTGTPLLRQERHFLEAEARFLALLGQNANPCIPQLYHYDPRGTLLGSSYLIRLYMKGATLSEMESRINDEERNGIDRHLGFLLSTIAQNVAPAFGSLQQVACGKGKRSWRESFWALFEGVLRDAEDMFIHLPYAEIRYEVARLASALDDVTLPRLVVVGFGRPSHVLLDESSKQLSGVVDFSSAFWGDVLMAEIFEDPSPAVLEGAGMPLTRTQSEETRLLMYAMPEGLHYRTLTDFSIGIRAIDWYLRSRYNTIGTEMKHRNSMRDGN